MKLWPIQLAVQEAPKDAFSPNGPMKYRVVAYEGDPGRLPCDECQMIPLTGTYTTSEEALNALHRSIRESFTRYEAVLLQHDIDGVRDDAARLGQRTEQLRDAIRTGAGKRFDPTWLSIGYRSARRYAGHEHGCTPDA